MPRPLSATAAGMHVATRSSGATERFRAARPAESRRRHGVRPSEAGASPAERRRRSARGARCSARVRAAGTRGSGRTSAGVAAARPRSRDPRSREDERNAQRKRNRAKQSSFTSLRSHVRGSRLQSVHRASARQGPEVAGGRARKARAQLALTGSFVSTWSIRPCSFIWGAVSQVLRSQISAMRSVLMPVCSL